MTEDIKRVRSMREKEGKMRKRRSRKRTWSGKQGEGKGRRIAEQENGKTLWNMQVDDGKLKEETEEKKEQEEEGRNRGRHCPVDGHRPTSPSLGGASQRLRSTNIRKVQMVIIFSFKCQMMLTYPSSSSSF